MGRGAPPLADNVRVSGVDGVGDVAFVGGSGMDDVLGKASVGTGADKRLSLT